MKRPYPHKSRSRPSDWERVVVPDGSQPCTVCELLTEDEEGLCVYCRREAQFLSNHHAPAYSYTTGAMEVPNTLMMQPSAHTGVRHIFRPVRATYIRWYAAPTMGGEGKWESAKAWHDLGKTVIHNKGGQETITPGANLSNASGTYRMHRRNAK